MPTEIDNEKQRGFILNEYEKKKAEEWIKEHLKTCKHAVPPPRELLVYGGYISYIFTPNSAFSNVEIKCQCSDETCDVTDFESV